MERTDLRLILSSALVLIFTSCDRPMNKPPVAEEVPATPAPTPVAVFKMPEPVATPTVAVATSTPTPDPIAPEGVFFLLAQTSVMTDDGILGLKPGTRLQKESEGKYLADGHSVDLRDDQVTNNLRLASLAARNDAATQVALQQSIRNAAQSAVINPSTSTSLAGAVTGQRVATTKAEVSKPDLAVKPTFGSGTLGATHSSDKANLKVDSKGRRYWTDVRGRPHYVE